MNLKNFKHIADSVQGKKRNENQDNFLILQNENFNLYILFDGVGGSLNGKKATQISKSFIKRKHATYYTNSGYDLTSLMFDTNEYLINSDIPDLKSTFCALCIINNTKQLLYSSLGDTRLYIINPQYIETITIDDKPFKYTNLITKCLGMTDLTRKDFKVNHLNFNESSKILMCTDGFYSLMEGKIAEFYEIFTFKSLFAIKKKLKIQIKGNNFDDSTYILIKQNYVLD